MEVELENNLGMSITSMNVQPLGSLVTSSTFERCLSLYNFAGYMWMHNIIVRGNSQEANYI